jgi:hypothetical protein
MGGGSYRDSAEEDSAKLHSEEETEDGSAQDYEEIWYGSTNVIPNDHSAGRSPFLRQRQIHFSSFNAYPLPQSDRHLHDLITKCSLEWDESFINAFMWLSRTISKKHETLFLRYEDSLSWSTFCTTLKPPFLWMKPKSQMAKHKAILVVSCTQWSKTAAQSTKATSLSTHYITIVFERKRVSASEYMIDGKLFDGCGAQVAPEDLGDHSKLLKFAGAYAGVCCGWLTVNAKATKLVSEEVTGFEKKQVVALSLLRMPRLMRLFNRSQTTWQLRSKFV